MLQKKKEENVYFIIHNIESRQVPEVAPQTDNQKWVPPEGCVRNKLLPYAVYFNYVKPRI